jgi:light-regulated signal transduction histidine kinase (bacteriophytochrome)
MDIFEGQTAIRERLLADATHRMKNIMGGISGFAALLLKDMDEQSSDFPLVERIQENVIRLDQFLVDVMTLLRERTLHPETIDLPSTIRDVCINYYQNLDDDNLTLPFNVECSHPRISFKGDPLLIRNGFYHALRFVDGESEKIDSFKIHSGETAIQIRCDFSSEESMGCLEEDIVAGLSGLESIDARLSLALCLKLIRLHGGDVSILHENGNRWALLLDLRKE